jgi:translocation and assembly module TamB
MSEQFSQASRSGWVPSNWSMRKRVGIGLLASLLIVIVVTIGLALWIVNTTSGTRWAVGLTGNLLDDALQVRQVEGTLAGPLTLRALSYRDPNSGMAFDVQHIALDLNMLDLLRAQLTVNDLDVRGVVIALGSSPEDATSSEPFSLQPPLNIHVDRLRLEDATVRRDESTLLQIDSAAAAGAWTDAGLNVRQLDVRSPQGELHFQADVSGSDTFVGTGEGRFRWQAGERTYAGTVNANAQDKNATLNLRLTSPVDARLQLDVEQRESMPWRLEVEMPTFDPREELLPGSAMNSLAASLNGSGDLNQGTLSGRVVVNGEPVQLERIHLARQTESVDLDAVVRLTQGTLRADGAVMLADAPTSAKLDINWQDVVIPKAWAGQILHTRGELNVSGTADAYAVAGTIELGPPQRLADIRLDVKGSTQSVQLQQFDIVQAQGSLQAAGEIDLKPVIAWRVNAQARHFDPGKFAVAWPGDMTFELKSSGQLRDGGPDATLQLTELSGQLRGRKISGRADLRLSPEKVLAGVMDVRSGNSRIQVQGERGSAMNASATIDIPSLNEWLPDTEGELRGQLTATGRWPEINIAGELRGSSLRVGAARAEAITLNFDVLKPIDPRGEATLDASVISVANLAFDTLQVSVDGDAARHTMKLDANGQPLSAQLLLRGGRKSQGDSADWSGTVEELAIEVQDAANLQLQQPTQITFSQGATSLSQTCFVDADIRICLEGSSKANGTLQAQYSLQEVPLALANPILATTGALALSGTLDGEGNIARDARGELNGAATLRSAQGQILRGGDPVQDPADVLLTYADLQLSANLKGSEASGKLAARLDDTGRLEGEMSLSGLGDAVTNVRGTLNAELPSMSVIEMFTPQLANVRGQLQLRADVSGTLDAPRIDGELNATGLATEIPRLGLKLHDGALRVAPRSDGDFALTGNITSGEGTVRFEGVVSENGKIELDVQGQRVLAADIPGARVIVDPKLQFMRDEVTMSLQGSVHIPSATVDLQKLPRTQSAQASSDDVVIVDAETEGEAQRDAIPLRANLQVTLGDDVTLAGFGLDASVTGQLRVREAPGVATSGSGEVRVAGTYKAYGQDLTIRQGQLLFADTPLDNPNLSIVAVRQVDDVVAGLRIQGTARNPELTVFSEPPMAQSNALAYLVTGKPLSEVGAGEGDLLQSAGRSIGAAAGGLLAKNIGQRLGVDEIAVKDNEVIGGTALTVGQYLSPRLYLSYGVGLFEPGEVVTLRYKISDKLSLEVLDGPVDSRAGLEYRIER